MENRKREQVARIMRAAAALCLLAAFSDKAHSAEDNLEDVVDSVVRPSMERDRVAGVQLSILQDGTPALIKGYGIDSISPPRNVDPHRSLFRLGSISKLFTWISVMQLLERGHITLESPINSHLPEELRIPDEGFSQPIRVIDLMNHASGLEEHGGMPLALDQAQLYSLKDYLKRQRPHRVREPGRFVVYSSYGTAIAGALVAHVSGEDFESYVERHILQPLQMQRTTFRAHYDPTKPTASHSPLAAPMPAWLVPDLSQGLEWGQGRWASFAPELSLRPPAGGAVSTAADMALWMSALLDPARLQAAGVLSASTFSLMKQDSFPAAPLAGMRHGFMRMRLGHENLSHGGGVLHFTSLVVVVPELRLGVFVSTNSARGAGLVEAVVKKVLETYYPAPSAPRDVDSAKSASEWDGWYLSMLVPETTIRKALGLSGVPRIRATATGDLVIGAGRAVTTLTPSGANAFTRPGTWQTISFERDPANGKIYVLDSPSTAERLRFYQTPGFLYASAAAGLITCIGVLIAAFRRHTAQRAESVWERSSRLCLNVTAIVWLVGAVLAGAWYVLLQQTPDRTLFLLGFPQPVMNVASAALSVGAVLTIIALMTLVPALRGGSWSGWRRLGAAVALIVLLNLSLALDFWNLVGFRYP